MSVLQEFCFHAVLTFEAFQQKNFKRNKTLADKNKQTSPKNQLQLVCFDISSAALSKRKKTKKHCSIPKHFFLIEKPLELAIKSNYLWIYVSL